MGNDHKCLGTLKTVLNNLSDRDSEFCVFCVASNIEAICSPPPPILENRKKAFSLLWVPNIFFYWHPKDYYLPETTMYRKRADECCEYMKKNRGSLETERENPRAIQTSVARAGQHADINFLRCTMKNNAR